MKESKTVESINIYTANINVWMRNINHPQPKIKVREGRFYEKKFPA